MNVKSLIKFIPLFVLPLSSCGTDYKYEDHMEDYILTVNVTKPTFRILQLTDMHIANKDDQDVHLNFIKETIEEADPDMIISTGDNFTFADKTTIKRLFSFLDSFKKPWSITFGNHDEQCYASVDWITGYLNNLNQQRIDTENTSEQKSYCVFRDNQCDDVFGYANYVVNLKKAGNVFRQLYILDSNRYDYSQIKGYDHIHEDQINWYKDMIDYSTITYGGGSVIPSLCYYHIPIPEFKDAWADYESRAIKYPGEGGVNAEGSSCPKVNSGFFAAVKEKASTQAMFVGHDHLNNYKVYYQGVWFVYGIHSSNRIYYSESSIGARYVDINTVTNAFTMGEIFRSYEEAK